MLSLLWLRAVPIGVGPIPIMKPNMKKSV